MLKIELDGGVAGRFNALLIKSGGTTVRGLVVNNWENDAIRLDGGAAAVSGVKIEGNFIGTDPAGTAAEANFQGVTSVGVATLNAIGGPSPAARNLISGNDSNGIAVGSGHLIQGNLIGTDKTGTKDLGNGLRGVVALGDGNVVEDNVVGFNAEAGVAVDDGPGNRILGNAIFANGGLGIDLGLDGRTGNDPGDGDNGPNNLQNFPLIDAATTSDRRTTIEGTLDSTAETTFTVQFFAHPKAKGAEGKTFLGQKQVTTDANGEVSFVFKLPRAERIPTGEAITATATRADAPRSTSEFSPPRVVKAER